MIPVQQNIKRAHLPIATVLLALIVSACSASNSTRSTTSSASKVAVTVADSGCQPTQLAVAAGESIFVVTNNSSQTLEWEILKNGIVVEERENIAPGFVQELKAKLDIGQYEMTCGLRSNPKGTIAVSAK